MLLLTKEAVILIKSEKKNQSRYQQKPKKINQHKATKSGLEGLK